MSPLTRVRDPEEIVKALQREYGVRAEVSGDPKSDEGATLFVWVKATLDLNEVRSRAASLCDDVYQHGFYVVPAVLPET